MRTLVNLRRSGFSMLLAILGLGATAPMARGDDIDRDMLKQGPDLIATLRERGYDNVGVLSFQIKRHNGEAKMNVGRLNAMLATRLENVLVLALKNTKVRRLGIVVGAGDVASQDPNATWRTVEGRKRLFEISYPLAWGKQDVKVDAFLTGLVRYSLDMTTADVDILVFDKKQPDKLDTIAIFKTRTTPNMLGDMGLDFVVRDVRERTRKAPPGAPMPPEIATFELKKSVADKVLDPGPITPKDTAVVLKEDDGLQRIKKMLSFKIYYDDECKGELDSNPEPPGLDQPVHFRVENLTDSPLAMVLRVNGVNTVDSDSQVKNVDTYARWVLQPHKQYAIYGFYAPKENAKPGEANTICNGFKGSNVNLLQTRPELAIKSRLGMIDLDVFVAGEEEVRGEADRCLSEPVQRAASFVELYKKVLETEARAIVLPPESSRELILPDAKNAKEVQVGTRPFTGRHIGHRTIVYDTPAQRPGKAEAK